MFRLGGDTPPVSLQDHKVGRLPRHPMRRKIVDSNDNHQDTRSSRAAAQGLEALPQPIPLVLLIVGAPLWS